MGVKEPGLLASSGLGLCPTKYFFKAGLLDLPTYEQGRGLSDRTPNPRPELDQGNLVMVDRREPQWLYCSLNQGNQEK